MKNKYKGEKNALYYNKRKHTGFSLQKISLKYKTFALLAFFFTILFFSTFFLFI